MAEISLSTHVLDTWRGQPAAGVTVRLLDLGGAGPVRVASAETDADGRIARLNPGALSPGPYQLVFEVGDYFQGLGVAAGFFTRVAVDFTVTEATRRLHVPLLVSPFSCTSYRGS